MIYFFTDFGFAGPYVGQMKSAFYEIAPDSVIIDLMHDAPKFDPKASAYILSALVDYLPQDSIIVGVVDPGVGNSSRRPIMIQADSYWFVGPDNGLFQHVVNKSITVNCYEIITDESISTSFHGRDVFAPAAAQLANYTVPVAKTINTNSLYEFNVPEDLAEVIYIDHYGNAMTGLYAHKVDKSTTLTIGDAHVKYARTFSSVKKGELFWYENSIGLVEISQNLHSAQNELAIYIGMPVHISKSG